MQTNVYAAEFFGKDFKLHVRSNPTSPQLAVCERCCDTATPNRSQRRCLQETAARGNSPVTRTTQKLEKKSQRYRLVILNVGMRLASSLFANGTTTQRVEVPRFFLVFFFLVLFLAELTSDVKDCVYVRAFLSGDS